MTNKSFYSHYEGSSFIKRLGDFIAQNQSTKIKGFTGSSLSFYVSTIIKRHSKPTLFIFNSKEDSLYFLNDIETLNPDKQIFYFPETTKEPYSDKEPNNYNLLQRTELIEHLNFSKNKNSIIVTHLRAISENQVNKNELIKSSIKLKVDQNISFDKLNEQLFELNFRREDFVVEPGEFAVRGGILDIFPYSSQTPYRIEFFGDEITRIRSFDIESQRSEKNHQRIKIISNIQVSKKSKNIQNIFDVINDDTVIYLQCINLFNSEIQKIVENAKSKFDNSLKKEDLVNPENLFININSVKKQLKKFKLVEFDSMSSKINFKLNIQPQPSFNKSFNLLIDDLKNKSLAGYHVSLCCTNSQQKKRLSQIFEDLNYEDAIDPVILPLSSGFIDMNEKMVFYTDHQIFERYHKFRFRKTFKNKLSIALKQINSLSKGDYVTHIDHGIGKYAGLQKIEVDGKMQESKIGRAHV